MPERMNDGTKEKSLVLEVEKGGYQIKIYKHQIKSLDQLNGDLGIQEKILEARKSYGVYGDVPKVDEYDNPPKGVSFLAEVKFQNNGQEQTIYYTMRLVFCGEENPLGSEDTDMFVNHNGVNTPVGYFLTQSNLGLDKVATISRLGALLPDGLSRTFYIGEAFAALNQAAISEAKKHGVEYIICQLHRDLQHKILVVNGKEFNFVPIAKQLEKMGIPFEGIFSLNRWDPKVFDYMLSYPGYFLEIPKLKQLLVGLGENVENLTWKNAKDYIPAIKKHKDKILDLVPDAVFLAFMDINDWENSIMQILNVG